ncbi:KGGVGR-motif variant AAA ATPase [Azospirillum thermophilum]|nr:AAA family ATPase [Azospirillum thermophilum]
MIHFDDGVRALVETAIRVIGPDAFEEARVFRDAFGRLGYCTKRPLNEELATELQVALADALGDWAYDEGTPVGPDSFAFDRLWEAPSRWELIDRQTEGAEPIYVDLADRRIVGQDWVVVPERATDATPRRLVFWSVKGGGGRTTALSVLAASLAAESRNVLVIDADLEAPGLGSMLLEKHLVPKFGLLDYLAESGLVAWEDADFDACVATSELTHKVGSLGLVDVVPAIGTATLAAPENMIAKLSRAFLEKPSEDGDPITVRRQLRTFVDRMAQRRQYDAVLIDARAGLSEFSASTLLGLGASVMVFGVDQPQTFQDLSFLFAHLSRLEQDATEEAEDWRRQIHFVESKSDKGRDGSDFRSSLHEMLARTFYEADEEGAGFTFSLTDEDAPHMAARIHFDPSYTKFDPIADVSVLKSDVYRAAYSEFLDRAKVILLGRKES